MKPILYYAADCPDTAPFVAELKRLGVDYEAVEPIASVITPVPGGVGPMTITCLMENTIELFLKKMNA